MFFNKRGVIRDQEKVNPSVPYLRQALKKKFDVMDNTVLQGLFYHFVLIESTLA